MLHKILSVISLLAVVWVGPQAIEWALSGDQIGVYISTFLTFLGAMILAIGYLLISFD